MTKPNPSERDVLLNQGLDFILNSPDDEFELYLRESGFDPKDVDARADAAFGAAFKTFGQQKRAAAKIPANRLTVLKQQVLAQLSFSRVELVATYQQLIAGSQASGARLSLQHRELSGEVSVDELRQVIAEVKALQLLNEDQKD